MPINSRKRVVIQLEHKYNLRGYFVITTEVYNPHLDEWVLDENSTMLNSLLHGIKHLLWCFVSFILKGKE